MNSYPFEPTVRVGVCENTGFGLTPHGDYDVSASEDTLTYTPVSDQAYMEVRGVRIGRDFHWDSLHTLRYPGVMQMVRGADGNTSLINILKVEKYLESVVGSEMHPQAPLEFVKAHAIIARSWLLRQLQHIAITKHVNNDAPSTQQYIRWTQADAHIGFDVCIDDHCQRYQGLDGVSDTSRQAVAQTRGVVLTDSQGEIADTRYSKCCGGSTELFSTCWEDVDYEYLQSVSDPYCEPSRLAAALKKSPTLLKDYDALTTDYYIWHREISCEAVRANILRECGIDIGDLKELKAIKRGPSGRIFEMLIRGDKAEITIGKELTIRRILSHKHLYSSAIDAKVTATGVEINGRGWGHGVGLCQIGAAVMATEGYTCEQILQHYFPGTHSSIVY